MSERNYCRVNRSDYSRGFSKVVRLIRRQRDTRRLSSEITSEIDSVQQYTAEDADPDYFYHESTLDDCGVCGKPHWPPCAHPRGCHCLDCTYTPSETDFDAMYPELYEE